MHWIIQDNLYREEGASDLVATLERFAIPHDLVKVLPFSDHLDPLEQTVPVVHPQGLVMVCGSTTLARIANRRGWVPGSFLNEDHDYRAWHTHYGSKLLNADARVCRFADVEPIWPDGFFIRPCEDTKSFAGQCMDWAEFSDWRRRVIELNETYTSLNGETMVSYGPIKRIFREARFFVVDGRIVTSSTYKIGSRISYSTDVPPTMVDFAQQMIDLWSPARAFVIDVALVDGEDEPKVVEINCLNSAGFYLADVQKLVMAIEAMDY